MKNCQLSFIALCLAGALLVGCGDDDASNGNDASVQEDSSTQNDSSVLPDASQGENTITGIVRNLLELPEDDVNVCLLDDEETCAVTADNGTVTLGVAPGDDPAVRISQTAKNMMLFPSIALVTVDGTRGSFVGAAIQRELVTQVLMSIDPKDPPVPDPAKGHLVIRAVGGTEEVDLDGIVFALEKGAASAVYYFGPGATEFVDPELTATSTRGYGLMLNIEPGVHTFTYTHDDLQCTVEAWEGDEADTYRVPIEAGTITYMRLTGCAP